MVGLATVLLSRGQDVRMEAGSTVEMEVQRFWKRREPPPNRDLVPVSQGQRLERPTNPGTR